MLTPEQVEFYRENGYVVVPGLLSPEEAAAYRQETHALAERLSRLKSMEATWESANSIEGVAEKKTQLKHCADVQFYSAAFSRLIVDERIVDAASQIIDSPNVQLHHTKMFIKPPEKGSPFPMHQDEPFFPHEKHSMIAVILHFDDAPIEKGCVRVVPGSHKLGPLEHNPEGSWHLPVDEYPVDEALPLPAKAGDAVFFSYLTIHGSGVNTSDEARTTLLIQMRDPADRPTERWHLSPGQGTMLRGIDPLERLPEVPYGVAPAQAGMGGGMGGAMGGGMGGGMGGAMGGGMGGAMGGSMGGK